MTYLSAGFSATCGHGYAVAFIQDGAWLCDDCWQGVRAFVHQATGVTLVLEGHDEKATSDASDLTGQASCHECAISLSVLDANEAADCSYEDRDEVQKAYAHLEGHTA